MVFQFHCLFEHLTGASRTSVSRRFTRTGIDARAATARGLELLRSVRRRASRRRAAAAAVGRRGAARRDRARARGRSAGAADGRTDGVARSRCAEPSSASCCAGCPSGPDARRRHARRGICARIRDENRPLQRRRHHCGLRIADCGFIADSNQQSIRIPHSAFLNVSGAPPPRRRRARSSRSRWRRCASCPPADTGDRTCRSEAAPAGRRVTPGW